MKRKMALLMSLTSMAIVLFSTSNAVEVIFQTLTHGWGG